MDHHDFMHVHAAHALPLHLVSVMKLFKKFTEWSQDSAGWVSTRCLQSPDCTASAQRPRSLLMKCPSFLHPSLRIIRGLVRHVKYLLGLRFEVSGWEHLQTEGPYVIISNHQSSLDVLGGYRATLRPVGPQNVLDLSISPTCPSCNVRILSWNF